ncbi:hypothetical protein P167DRAFT_580483 [Morchella conica CCBAS932]|uniref:Uncharacterized protein n=1 Tax=Morchella conica CCBAS932 TaxID=1392247 RepID=A0A3N4KAT7_9PEZI|nr:hypothetical protein P167DRAFT_580483 [Morchella conica CCBAS932]
MTPFSLQKSSQESSSVQHQAAEIDYLDEHYHRHNIHTLPDLCLVPRLFYKISSPLIYRDVIIPAGWDLESIVKQLVPLLSREQRRKLRESLESARADGGETEDAEKLLVDQERIVDPACVKRLII